MGDFLGGGGIWDSRGDDSPPPPQEIAGINTAHEICTRSGQIHARLSFLETSDIHNIND